MKTDRDLKAWAAEERKLMEDPRNMSDVAWRRRELAHATDLDPNGHCEGIEIGESPTNDEINLNINWCSGN